MSFVRFLIPLVALCCAQTLAAQNFLKPGNPPLVTPSLVADTEAVGAGKPFTVGVRMKFAPGWHTYWQFPGDSGAPVVVEWQLPAGFTAGPLQWPIPTAHMDDGDMLTYVYEGEVLLLTEITPPAQLPAREVALKAEVKWLVCEQTCVPGNGPVELKLPAGAAQPANGELFAKWRALLPRTAAPLFAVKWDRSRPDEFSVRLEGLAKDVMAEFFPLPPEGVKPGHPKTSEIAADGARTITMPLAGSAEPRGVIAITRTDGAREGWLVAAKSETAAPPPRAGGLLWKLVLAYLGGLIMNVMPCVLPVIALKIFGFVNQAGQDPARVFRLGLAFNAGVFAFFLGLAAAVAKLKSAFNWGYQFQNPFLLAALIALIFVFSLNLLGVFEIALSGGAATTLSKLASHEGWGGAFMHGFFTTLLGTSCTAPFLSTSLGFAVTQRTPVIFLLFLAIAAGMATPYFLLTARPAWLRYVPKPGAWMERAKQLMGFAMLAVAVWLLGVLGESRGAETSGAMSWFLLALGLACWIFGAFRGSRLAWMAVLALAVGGYFGILHGRLSAAGHSLNAQPAAEAGGIAWQPYSEEALAGAQRAEQPVFIDFTAKWCVNCKVYERAVLETDAVRAKFREKKIVAFKADWTNADPVVTRALKSFGRVGVPLYVLHRAGEDEPVVMDALTSGGLLAELEKIRD